MGDSITEFNLGWTDLNAYLGTSGFYNRGLASSTVTNHTGNAGLAAMQTPTRIDAIPLDTSVLVLFGGTNDWFFNTPLGSINDLNTDDRNGTNTFYGALNRMIDLIRNRLRTTELFYITPIQRNFNYSESETNTQGLRLRDYVDAIVLACGNRSVPVLDTHRHLGIARASNLIYNTYDGIHLDRRGYAKLEWFLGQYISGIYPRNFSLNSEALRSVIKTENMQDEKQFFVRPNNDILYTGPEASYYSALSFQPSVRTIEFTLDSSSGSWIGLGGRFNNYTAIAPGSDLIGNFTYPSFSNVIGLTRLTNAPNTGRYRITKGESGYSVEVQLTTGAYSRLYQSIHPGKFPNHSGFQTDASFCTSHVNTSGTLEANIAQLKNVRVNGRPLYQAIREGL